MRVGWAKARTRRAHHLHEKETVGTLALCPPYGQHHHTTTISVIACDKREAFAQGERSDEAIHLSRAEIWIASLRSQ
jgi:hypothetical protein